MQVSDVYENLLNRVIALSVALDNEQTKIAHVQHKLNESRVDSSEVSRLMLHMANNKKIDAINSFRHLTGMGLKESKDVVESVMDRGKRP
jgi:ribosomal protein L7/L12